MDTDKFGQAIYTVVQNLVRLLITECTCRPVQLCIGYSGVYIGHYRDVKGRLFVSYEPYLVLLKYMACIDIYNSC